MMYNLFKCHLYDKYNLSDKYNSIIIDDLINNKISKNKIIKLLNKYNGVEIYDITIQKNNIKKTNNIKMFLQLKFNIKMDYDFTYEYNNELYVIFNELSLGCYLYDCNLSIKDIRTIYNLFNSNIFKKEDSTICFKNKYDLKKFVNEFKNLK